MGKRDFLWPASVTDDELVGKIRSTVGMTDNAPAVLALCRRYLPGDGKVREIPQEKRAAFLAELSRVPHLRLPGD
jgi:hypothetical protein